MGQEGPKKERSVPQEAFEDMHKTLDKDAEVERLEKLIEETRRYDPQEAKELQEHLDKLKRDERSQQN